MKKREAVYTPAIVQGFIDGVLRQIPKGLSLTSEFAAPCFLADALVTVRLHVRSPHRFVCWYSTGKPTGRNDRHIVPRYHPALLGWKKAAQINGDTDAICGGSGKTVKYIAAPRAAQALRHHKTYGRAGHTWRQVKHPFFGAGRSIELGFVLHDASPKKAKAELVKILRAMLGLDDAYVSVIGGFNPPLRYPGNRLSEIRLANPPNYRGSEAHCVWAHRLLAGENRLDDSFIPEWFEAENWRGIYEGAEVRPGIF